MLSAFALERAEVSGGDFVEAASVAQSGLVCGAGVRPLACLLWYPVTSALGLESMVPIRRHWSLLSVSGAAHGGCGSHCALVLPAFTSA